MPPPEKDNKQQAHNNAGYSHFELSAVPCLWNLIVDDFSSGVHEIGHALGYMLATGDRHWHIRVGSGKKLQKNRRLTVYLFPVNGWFTLLKVNKIDTTAKLIAMVSGGPAVSLILVAVLLTVKFGGISLYSKVIASKANDCIFYSTLVFNLIILIRSLIPRHYFHGEVKGMETDGMKIINAIRSRKSKS